MNKNRKKAFIMITLIFTIFVSYNVFFRNNEAEALSKYGSRGEEVRQIQTKLKRWGYYKGNVDGIFGSGTQAAVRYFQSKNGLAVDGIAGKNTLAAMGIYSSSGNSSGSSSSWLKSFKKRQGVSGQKHLVSFSFGIILFQSIGEAYGGAVTGGYHYPDARTPRGGQGIPDNG